MFTTQCHTRIVDETDDQSHLYSSHAQLSCFVCHDDPTLAELHEDADAETGKKIRKLKKTVVSNASCLSCHEATALIEATEEIDVLTDANKTTVNPHDIPENTSHDSVVCTDCHEFHVENSDVEKKSQKTCLSCHHGNVYECGTCHSVEP